MTLLRVLASVPDTSRAVVRAGFAFNTVAVVASVAPIAIVGWALVMLADGADGCDLAPVAAAALLILVVVQLVLTIVGGRVGGKASFAAVRRLRTDVLMHAARIPVAVLKRHGDGALARLVVEDARLSLEFLSYAFPQAMGHIVTAALLLVVLMILSPVAAAAVIVAAGCAVLAMKLFTRRVHTLMQRRATAFAVAADSLMEHIQSLAVLRAFGRASDSTAPGHRAIDVLDGAVRGSLPLTLAAGRFGPLVLDVVAIPIFLGSAYASGTAPIPTVLGLLVLLELVRSLHLALDAVPLVKLGTKAGVALADFLREPEVAVPERPRPFPSGQAISFEDVTFAYAGHRPALESVTLTIPATGLTAITGPSGAGKSTLLSLLLREADPNRGRIRVGGVDLRDIDPRALLANIAVVGQNIDLLADTLASNLRLAAPGAAIEALHGAIAQAGLTPLLARLPHGLETVLGDDGATLSGGERQRVAIARALLKGAPVLLFDEATSALDPETESTVIASLRQIAAGRVVIVVTHRLASIAAADRIAVLEESRLTAVGRHEDLMTASPTYRRLWAAHDRTKGWSLSRGDERADHDAISSHGGNE